jgi:hypothetical protein
MSDKPKKGQRGWIGAIVALFGAVLIYGGYDFKNDTPLSALPDHIFIFPGLGVINGAVLVGSLFGAGLLLVAVGLLASVHD